MHRLKYVMILVCGLIMASFSLKAEKWMDFNATNFPDQNFRSLLSNSYKSAFDATGHPGKINVDAITELNLGVNRTDAKNIVDAKGVELLRNLTKISLWESSNSSTVASAVRQLKKLDVSGLQYLTTITCNVYTSINNTKSWPTSNGKNEIKNIGAAKKTCLLQTLIADNCPRLKEIKLTFYANLETLSIEGSDNIEELYLADCQALKSLDVSGLKNLTNDGACTQIPFSKCTNLSLLRCKALEKLVLAKEGEESPLEFLDLTDCIKLKEVDLSSLRKAKYIFMNNNSTAATDNVILGEHPVLEKFQFQNTNLSKIDFSALSHASNIKLSSSLFSCIETEKFTSATTIDIQNNKLRHITLPPNRGCTSFEIGGNELTDIPQFRQYSNGDWKYTYPAMSGRTSKAMTRNVGSVMKYRILDSPESAQFFVKTDNGIYAKAPVGAHLGEPADGEDPCYIYFDDDFREVTYYLWVPYKSQKTEFASDLYSYYNIKLTRNGDGDLADQDFYIVGEFNNWQANESHKFIYEGNGRYTLSLNEGITGCFRVVNATDLSGSTLSFGGHPTQVSVTDALHVQVLPNTRYILGEDPEMHYSSSPTGDGSITINNPAIEMHYIPGDAHNYLMLGGGNIVTGIENVCIDKTTTPTQYFDLNGRAVSSPQTPGIYIRCQGTLTDKIIIR